MKELKTKLLKQRLYSLHSSLGVFISLFMYISLFFGIFTIFKPFITVWEKPSRHFERIDSTVTDYEKILKAIISNPNYPKNNIYIELPGYFDDPAIKITHRFMPANYFNPYTNQKIEAKNELSYLGGFLNHLHYGRPFMIIGKIIFGLIAIGTMVLILGGLMLIIKMKFNNKGRNGQANFSKWHRKIFLYTSPIFLIIVLTGALMNIGYITAKPLTSIVTKGESNDIISFTSSVLKPAQVPIKSLEEEVKMLSISKLIQKAKNINTSVNYQKIKLINWNDKTARVQFIGYNPYKPFLNGVYNKEKVLLSAVDGRLIKDIRAEDSAWVILFADAFYFIHLLYDVDIFTRIFVALLMGLSTFAIGFGMLLWLERKAKIFDGKVVFYHWLGRFSLAIMLGVIPSTAILFITQWLLPFDLANKITIQQIIFYNSWLGTLVWSLYRLNSYKAAKEFLFSGGILFILASIIHQIVSGFSLFSLYESKMFDILSVDLSLIILGSILIIISIKLPKNRESAKFFWNKKYTRST